MTLTPTAPSPDQQRESWGMKREELERSGVKYCYASFVDVHGIPKAKSVPIDHFEGMLGGSELFTGAALDGLGQGPNDDELSVHPEISAITALPWEPTVAWAPGFLYYHGEHWPMCSRWRLQRQVERAAAIGLKFNVGVETELYLVRRENGRIVPANANDTLPKAAYDVVGLLENQPFMDQMAKYMNALGWGVFSMDHEDANSQFEFDFGYTDCMAMADRLLLMRMMAKFLARRQGCEVTWMPKPFGNRTGTGAHFNMSLADISTGENRFGRADDPRQCGISDLAYGFIAGVLRHAPAITALTAPTVNSYKRLVKSGSMTGYTWAPVYISYGRNNRTNMLRIPMTSPRVECRAVDATCNPYLASAMFLAAGLEGIQEGLDPGEPIQTNLYELDEQQLRALGIKVLPRTLLEATDALEADPLAEQVLGSELLQSYLDLKRREWWEYHNTISQWEIDRYLTQF